MTNEHETRRAPHMEHYTEIVPGSVDAGHGYLVRLVVDHQSFTVTPEGETREEAEWMRDMLCIALDRVAEQRTKELAADLELSQVSIRAHQDEWAKTQATSDRLRAMLVKLDQMLDAQIIEVHPDSDLHQEIKAALK